MVIGVATTQSRMAKQRKTKKESATSPRERDESAPSPCTHKCQDLLMLLLLLLLRFFP